MKAHQYRKAIAVLKEYSKDDPSRIWEYKSRALLINKEWRLWTGFSLSVLYIALILIIIIAIKPWREKDLQLIKLKLLFKLITLLAVFTLIPMLIVSFTGNGVYKTFPTLTIFASIALVLTGLLTPVSCRISRGVYLLISFFLTVAVTYISFYIWDTLFVFWTQVRF